MKTKILQPYFIALIVILSSCQAYKDVPYYQNLDRSRTFEEAITNYSPLKIQPGDIIGINVSTTTPDGAAMFSSSLNRPMGNNSETLTTNPVYGYHVDPNGIIQLPYIGEMKVLGLTTDELAKQLSAGLATYLTKPIVNVRIINFKISVMGDVLRPDVYTVANQHININEALSMAGDLNITAKRKNVLLIREQEGKRQYFTIDLTRKDLFNSQYYYLKNNDILYIEPDRTKYDTVDRSYRTSTLAISAVSALTSIVVSLLLLRKY
ncbi:MAG: polysaccharide export protein [Bacteroidota bacterium]|nr:polysaccharide export protein [Bacteroidota bacterium]